MSLVLKDRVRETTTVLGTNDATLLGAVTGFQAFSVVGNGNTCYYTISDQSGGNWEVGIGTYSTVGPTLARTTILASSNSGSIVSFPAGTKDVFLTYPSEKAVFLDASGNLNIYSDGELRLNDSAGGEYVALKSPATLAASYTLTMPVDDGTNGQALITDGSGNLSWSTSASGDVYGPASATDNAVARFDGTTGKLIQNSVAILSDAGALSGLTGVSSTSLTDSGLTSGRVTYASTGGLLADSANLTFDGTYLVANSIKDSALTSGRVTYAGASGLLQDSANLTFDGTTLTAANITSSGTWTISGGTANGVAYLNGSKVLTTGSALTFNGSILVNTAGGIAVQGGGAPASGYGWEIYNNGATENYLQSYNRTGGSYMDSIYNAATHQFKITGAEQMRLTSTGLGIGTSSPSTKLHVAGNALVSQPSSANSYVSVSGSSGSYSGILSLQRGGTEDGSVYCASTNYNPASASIADLVFSNGGGGRNFRWANNTTLAMTLDSSGNLGLGVTPVGLDSRFKNFEIGASTSVSDIVVNSTTLLTYLQHNSYVDSSGVTKFKYSGGSNYASQYSQTNGQHLWQTSTAAGNGGSACTFTTAMTLDASGNLGVGTSSPVFKLDVASTIKVFSATQSSINFGVTGSSVYAKLEYDDTNGNFNLNNPRAFPIRFLTNDTERMRIDSSGNVGIGTSSPSNKLTVSSTAQDIALFTYNSTTGLIKLKDGTTANAPAIGVTGDNLQFFTGSGPTERMRLDSSGDVGIGTSSPSARLTLSQSTGNTNGIHFRASGWNSIGRIGNNGTVGGDLIISENWNAASNTVDSSADATAYINLTASGGTITFGTGGTNTVPSERMRITSGGEVYIAGTTDQGAYNLQCNGTGVWGAGAYVNGSDAALKENVTTLDNSLGLINAMRPVTFTYKENYSKDRAVQTGFIAQELQEVLAGKDYLDGIVQAGPEHLNVAYQNLIPLLVKAVQELTARVAQLEGN